MPAAATLATPAAAVTGQKVGTPLVAPEQITFPSGLLPVT